MGKDRQFESRISTADTMAGKKYLGDPAFEPVWAALSKQGSVVFVHPADTVMPPNMPFGPCENGTPQTIEDDPLT